MRQEYTCRECGATFLRYPSQPHVYCSRSCMYAGRTGPKHWAYKGRWTNARGYVFVRVAPDKVVREHRLVVERELGRSLSPTEHVHHRDRDKGNNAPENLEVIDPALHASLHAPERKGCRHRRR